MGLGNRSCQGEWRDEDKTVLVHCVQAERRTPAIAAAYLAERTGLSGNEAFNAVTRTLPGTRVNRAFMEALMRLWPHHREVGVS
jgi:protein-tyrosine phosphatase